MSKQTRVIHPIYSLLPTDLEGFDSLAELALDMRWSWNHRPGSVFSGQCSPIISGGVNTPQRPQEAKQGHARSLD